jgi:hypothetical protein
MRGKPREVLGTDEKGETFLGVTAHAEAILRHEDVADLRAYAKKHLGLSYSAYLDGLFDTALRPAVAEARAWTLEQDRKDQELDRRTEELERLLEEAKEEKRRLKGRLPRPGRTE